VGILDVQNQEAGPTAHQAVVATKPLRVQCPRVVLLEDGAADLLIVLGLLSIQVAAARPRPAS
jgi:hypothetical protein